ncbi:MAG: hypothetical protein JW889_08885 [Verrucomicrobia bacterium]|nr:hypothetical protein [Verrucomicrobiota bacterium]
MTRPAMHLAMACLAALLAVVPAALAVEQAETAMTDEQAEADELEAQRLDELRAKLMAVDLVVRAEVTNVLTVGDRALLVLAVHDTYRGATARLAIYAETAKEFGAGLQDYKGVWLLRTTDNPRHFALDGPEALLDLKDAEDVSKALETVTYATLADLKLTVALDKPVTMRDEPIRLTWTIENPSGKPLVIAQPDGWAAMFGITLTVQPPDGEDRPITVLDVKAGARPLPRSADVWFRTLDPTRPKVSGTVSLLRLVSGFNGGDYSRLPTLPAGTATITITADTTPVNELPGIVLPRGTLLGRLDSAPLTFEITAESIADLDEAKAIATRMAGVENLDEAIKSNSEKDRARALQAVVDYACPPLLPIIEGLLATRDQVLQAAACEALLMWARHPAVVNARPLEKRLEAAPIGEELSLIASTASEIAEVQHDPSMIPLLLRFLGDEHIDRVSKQRMALSMAAIAGLTVDETELDEAAFTIKQWVEKNPDKVKRPEL